MKRLFSGKKIRCVSFFYLLLGVFIISSCAVKKKSTERDTKPPYGGRESPELVIGIQSDASDSKSVRYTTNTLDNYAKLLGVDVSLINNNKRFYLLINDWMGTPHQLGGMNRNGVDCSGFVYLIYKELFNHELPRRSADMGEIVKRKYENQLKEGDLLFFSFGGKGIDHVGIYLHNHKFVHVSTRRGVIISSLKDSWYYTYFTRAGTSK